MTGLLFVLLVLLIILSNYLVLSKNASSVSVVADMKIDKVYNRWIDVYRALDAVKTEAAGDLDVCDENMNSVLSSPLLDSDGIIVTGSASGCIATFVVESYDGFAHKEGTYP